MTEQENPVPAEPVTAVDAVADASNGGAPRRRAPRRRSAPKQAETTEAVVAAGAEHAEPAPSSAADAEVNAGEDAAATAPRSRTRRRRAPVQATAETEPRLTDEAPPTEAVVGEGVTVEPTLDPPIADEQRAEQLTAAETDSIASAPDEVMPEPAEQPASVPASAWSPRRRYEIGPDGTVRFLDDRSRQAISPNMDHAEAPPSEEVPAPEALAESGETAAAVARPSRNRRGEGWRREQEEPPLVAAEAVQESAIVADAAESDAAIDEAAGIDQGFIEGEENAEGGDQLRRRRRSRRGGRGRRRNGAAPDGIDVGEALEGELAEAEGVALPVDLASEPEEESPQLMPSRERPDRAAGGLSPLESLVARQNVILDQLLQRQERMARSMEQALKSVEARLRGTDLSHVSAMPRIAVFVDVPNIMYAAERYRVAVDFGKLLDYVAHDRTLIRASAYAPISDDPTQRLEVQRFVEPFVNHGYRIVTKPLKRFADGSIKANFDVELAMDILTMSDRLDIVSLVSGDGDFRRLVDIVASKGVRVEVVSFAQSTSSELKAVADTYIDLTQHLKDLCMPVEGDFKPRVPRPRIDISGYYE